MACEHTLRVMRRGRETLLTLLEAFVYDPLVDWRAGADNSIATYGACQARARCTGVGRKQLEVELTRAMFAVRTTEMRSEWLANRLVVVFNIFWSFEKYPGDPGNELIFQIIKFSKI